MKQSAVQPPREAWPAWAPGKKIVTACSGRMSLEMGSKDAFIVRAATGGRRPRRRLGGLLNAGQAGDG